MAPIRVLIAESDPALRWHLSDRLARDPEMEVVGAVGDGREVVARTVALRPDVLRLQLELPDITGLEVIYQLAARSVPTRVLVVAWDESAETILRVLTAEARGFLTRGPGAEYLPEGIRAVANGEIWINRRIVRDLEAELAHLRRRVPEEKRLLERLTEVEREVLVLLAWGLSNPEIAGRMHLSTDRVGHVVSAILEKLEVKNRILAARAAWRAGLATEEFPVGSGQ